MEENNVYWGFHIHARGDSLIKQGYIALGWPEVGDLKTIGVSREAFKVKVRQVYGDKPHITNSAGQLFRFFHEMKIGDYVIYRSKVDRQIYIGEVTSGYEYNIKLSAEYCNLRSVDWGKPIQSSTFSQGALYELGSALTLFQVKKYAGEYLAALTGKSIVAADEDEETVSVVAEEVLITTGDFILKELERQLKGYPFQGFIANLLQTMGYRTFVTPQGTDDGIDIIAHKDELKLEPPIIKVQVKSGLGSVGGPDVKALVGNLGDGEYGLVVTLGTFSAQAKGFEKQKPNLRLIDGKELVEFVLDHYEELDPRYKTMIPLKRIYVPQPITQETGEL